MMIDVNCYYCQSEKHTFYAEENGFNLVKCTECGLLYVTPRPEINTITRAHQYGMHEGEAILRTTGRYSTARSMKYKRVLKDLYNSELVHKHRKWLDIGCGQGEFLSALTRYSKGKVKVTGLEPNQYKRESARKRGLVVEYFDIEDCSEKYDNVSLLNVYSHLPNPVDFIASIRQLLNQEGEILIQTGDVAHFTSAEMYRPMLLPDHLSFTSQEQLSGMLERCGFQTIKIAKYPVVSFTPINILKESAKLILPGKTSMIRCFLNQKYRTDMYIRARLVS